MEGAVRVMALGDRSVNRARGRTRFAPGPSGSPHAKPRGHDEVEAVELSP
jgi:hypothetical protein